MELVERRAAVLLNKKNAQFNVDDLIADVNSSRSQGQLKKLVGDAISAKRLLHRAPTPFESQLMLVDENLPISKLHQYVVLEYKDNAAREAAIEPLKRDKSFLYVSRDELTQDAALPTEQSGWLGGTPTVNNQWGMHLLNFPNAWNKQTGRAWVTVLDNGIWENSPDLNSPISLSPVVNVPNYRKHLSFNSRFLSYFDKADELKDVLVNAADIPFAGHGTHVASIIAGTHNNGGTAGGCPGCSLIAIRKLDSTLANAANVARAVDIGSQVINMSFETVSPQSRFDCLTTDANRPLCIALTHAAQNGVSMLAAAGNFANRVKFDDLPPLTGTPHPELYPLPATHPSVLAVSGLQYNGVAMSFWAGASNPGWNDTGPIFGSNFGQIINGTPEISFAAPAQKVLASVYPGWVWNDTFTGELGCGDQQNPASGPNAVNDGIGFCTGTSMSAPHVSAMAGLVKSANPLLDTAGVKSVLIQASECLEGNLTAPCTLTSSAGVDPQKAMKQLGYGVPKADKAVQLALGGPTAKNRLTPLFGYYNTDGDNHFYTTNPQMAIAAKRNTLQPAPKYRLDPPFVDCAITPGKCVGSGFVDQIFTTTLPNGAVQSGVRVEAVFQSEFSNAGAVRANATTTNAVATNFLPINPNVAGRTVTSLPAPVGANEKIRPISITTYPLTYQEIGLPIPGYPNLPCGSTYAFDSVTNVATNNACQYYPARAVAMLLTTHVDPTNTGRILKKVYRFSCNPDDPCNITDASNPKKPYHVAFRYSTNETLLSSIQGEGYKLDGIEGYVYEPVGEPPAGAQRFCSRRNAARHDAMLYLTASNTCYSQDSDPFITNNPQLPAGINGSGYNEPAELLGYAYPVQQPKALPEQPRVAAQSINGDQYADIVWRYNNASTIVMYTQQGYQTIGYTQLTQSMSDDWRLAGVADFNGDGNADLFWVGRSGTTQAGNVRIWYLAGANVVSFASFTHALNFEFVGVGDFDGDGRSDILWRETGAIGMKYLAIWFVDGHNLKPATGLVSPQIDATWKIGGVADLNSDGKADIVFRQIGTGAGGKDKLRSWLMNANALAAEVPLPDVPGNTAIKGIADINGDGHADIVFLDAAGNVGVWLLQNGGYFAGQYIAYGINSGWNIVGLRDFDGDGKSDIFWRYTDGSNAFWLLDGLSIKGASLIETVPPVWKAQPETP